MTEADRIFKESLKKHIRSKLVFRLPGLLKMALDQYKLDNIAYPFSNPSELYSYLCHESLYNAYSSKFRAAREGEKVAYGSISMDYLSSFGVNPKYYLRIAHAHKKAEPMAVFVPKIVEDFLRYMAEGLGVDKSPSQMYKELTEKILIRELEPQIKKLFEEKEREVEKIFETQQKLKL